MRSFLGPIIVRQFSVTLNEENYNSYGSIAAIYQTNDALTNDSGNNGKLNQNRGLRWTKDAYLECYQCDSQAGFQSSVF